MFRLQNNTPPIYTEGSRDFQLFCRLYDCVNNAVKFDINTITNIIEPAKANDRILELMCTRTGFFTKYDFDSNILRAILSAFPYILKYKGSKKGIELAVGTILKLEGNNVPPRIYINNENYCINIYISTRITNLIALDELLSYVLPIGYTYTIEPYSDYNTTTTIITKNTIESLVSPTISNSQVAGTDRDSTTFKTDMERKYISTFEISEVIGSNNYLTADNIITTSYKDINGNTIKTTRDEIDISDSTTTKSVKKYNTETGTVDDAYNTVLITTDTNPKGDN